MNQLTTLENEVLMFVDKNARNMENYRFKCLLRFPEYDPDKYQVSAPDNCPGNQVISNIMGYARSLEVIRKPSGKPIFLIGN